MWKSENSNSDMDGKEKKEFIQKNYQSLPIEDIMSQTGLSKGSVLRYACKLGVTNKRGGRKPSHQTKSSIMALAEAHGIQPINTEKEAGSVVLTDEDKKYIDRHLGKMSLKEICEKRGLNYSAAFKYTCRCGEEEMPRKELESKYSRTLQENSSLKDTVKELSRENEELKEKLKNSTPKSAPDSKKIAETARIFMCAMLVFDVDSDPEEMTKKCKKMAQTFHETIDN